MKRYQTLKKSAARVSHQQITDATNVAWNRAQQPRQATWGVVCTRKQKAMSCGRGSETAVLSLLPERGLGRTFECPLHGRGVLVRREPPRSHGPVHCTRHNVSDYDTAPAHAHEPHEHQRNAISAEVAGFLKSKRSMRRKAGGSREGRGGMGR